MGLCMFYPVSIKNALQEGTNMRGYFTAAGFYGLVGKVYMLFASEAEYYECMAEG